MKIKKTFLLLLNVFILISWVYVSATDFKWITHDTKNWTITISSNWESIILADKNVWATNVWYWKYAGTDSYWFYYQWGWMTWYKYNWTSTEAISYWFEKDINMYLTNIDWWTVAQQVELCGIGYHIPTREERWDVLKMYNDNWNDIKDFYEAFQMPFAWERSFLGANTYNIGENARFWTISPNVNNYAYIFRVDGTGAYNNYGSIHVYGHTIRCFKDKKSTKNFNWVTYDASKWTITITDWKSNITIKDKNVWATDVWYWINANRLSYGNYYQRWWATWYSYHLTKEEAFAKGFVSQRINDDTGKRDDATANIESWDGRNLCWNWYHIPSYTEWVNLINLFKSNWNNLSDFYEAFLIPSAGERTYFDVNVTQERFNANLWSSTPWWNSSIYYLYGNKDNIKLMEDKRANGFPVRCFKDMSLAGVWSVSLKNNTDYINDEMIKAHQFAYENGITSISNVSNAQLNNNLTRIAMAKMLSQYAINILWKTPDKSKTANFSDVPSSLDKSYNYWVTLSYQLWIMGIWTDKFRPNDIVTRAEFWTALSRMIYSISDWNPYYVPHLNKLKSEWIINNTNPDLHEKRWYVMLMLMRSIK